MDLSDKFVLLVQTAALNLEIMLSQKNRPSNGKAAKAVGYAMDANIHEFKATTASELGRYVHELIDYVYNENIRPSWLPPLE